MVKNNYIFLWSRFDNNTVCRLKVSGALHDFLKLSITFVVSSRLWNFVIKMRFAK